LAPGRNAGTQLLDRDLEPRPGAGQSWPQPSTLGLHVLGKRNRVEPALEAPRIRKQRHVGTFGQQLLRKRQARAKQRAAMLGLVTPAFARFLGLAKQRECRDLGAKPSATSRAPCQASGRKLGDRAGGKSRLDTIGEHHQSPWLSSLVASHRIDASTRVSGDSRLAMPARTIQELAGCKRR
jgi:hypothetical protein